MAGGQADAPAHPPALSGSLPRSPVSLWRPLRADPRAFFDADQVARSKAYQRPAQGAGLLGSAVALVVMLGLVGLRVPARAIGWLGVGAWPVQLLVAVAITVVVVAAAGLPFAVWAEFVHEKRWGFSRMTPGLFISDGLKGLGLGFLLLAALTEALWWLMRLTPLWWLVGAAVMVAVGLVLATILPTVIIPIFNRLDPLPDGGLRDRLAALAARAGVQISAYLVMDASRRTTKDNAFFAGMGRTRRVVVFDNLLTQGDDAVEVVVAHEIGHWRRRHSLRQLSLEAGLTLLTFGLVALVATWPPLLRAAGVLVLSDPSALPLFLLLYGALGFAGGLVTAWHSRWLEREADLDSLELTGAPTTYRRLWRSMSERNLPDLDPSWWKRVRGSHPPVAERLRFADVWEAKLLPR